MALGEPLGDPGCRPHRQHHLPGDQQCDTGQQQQQHQSAGGDGSAHQRDGALLAGQRENQIQLKVGDPRRSRGADQQRRTGEPLGAHGLVLITHLPGLDEIAQRARYLVHGAGGGGLTGAVTGNDQHRVEGTRQSRVRRLSGLGDQRGAGQLQTAVQRPRLFTADDPADDDTRPVDLLGRGANLDVEHPVGDLAGEHEAENHDDQGRQTQGQDHHPQLQRPAPDHGHRSTQRTRAPYQRARPAPRAAKAPLRGPGHCRGSSDAALTGWVTEVRPCNPLLERSRPPAGSPGPSRPWPATAGHAR